MKMKILLLTASVFLAGQSLQAQESSSSYGLPKKKDFDKWSIGLSGGINWFQGDVNENTGNNSSVFDNIKNPVFGLKLGYQLSHSTQINLRGAYTELSGTKKKTTFRYPDPIYGKAVTTTIDFSAPVIQASLNANYTLGNISFLQRNKKFHFFGELGFGFFNFKTKANFVDSSATGGLQKVELKKKGVSELVIPISLGFKYQLKRFDIGLMYTFNKNLTDKVDQVYDSKTESDNYSFIQLGVNYTLGKKAAMMEWVNPMEVVYNDLNEMKDRVDVLSGDKDKDGVSDLFDKDNSTPEGSHVYGDGTGLDTDGDGVPDNKDADPFSFKGAKIDANGLEVDSDGDGVPDSKDLEPNTAKGSLVNFQGVTIAPAGEYGKEGITSSSATGWLPSIFFDTDQSSIKQAYHDRLNTVARVMIKNPNMKLKVVGNCDVDASETYNQKLGEKRAEAAKNHLVKIYGIDPARLTTESLGKKEQMAKGMKRMNRRVDFEIAK